MKKILVLLITVLLCAFALVSCGSDDDDELGGYIHNYPETIQKADSITLDLYIITDDRTSSFAEVTVKRMITQLTELDFNTKLVVHYVKADEYENTLTSAINSNGENSADIVLINSSELMQKLVADKKLADLTSFLETRDYGALNSQIPKALLDASKIDKKLYSIPNNHLLDEYEYLVIDIDYCRDYLKFNNSKLKSYKSMEDAAELISKIEADGKNPSDYIYMQTGLYNMKAELEKAGKICNVVKYPTVTANEAFESAFAIVNRNQDIVERSMEILYAMNTDEELRNLFQYGVEGTNYVVNDGDIVRVSNGENQYYMNLIYTGDIFKADFCSEIGWTKEAYENAYKQNNEAVAD